MADDVWTWEITRPESAEKLEALFARTASGFEVCENEKGQALRVWLDKGDEEVTLAGASVAKKEGSRNLEDLRQLVEKLADRIRSDQIEQLRLNRKLSEIVTTIHQKVDRLQRREELEKQRVSGGAQAIGREFEDLHAIPRQLEEHNQ